MGPVDDLRSRGRGTRFRDFAAATMVGALAAACASGPAAEPAPSPPAPAVEGPRAPSDSSVRSYAPPRGGPAAGLKRLPTGAWLDPEGTAVDVGTFPLSLVLSPDGGHALVLLSGWREQGLQVVDIGSGRVTQTLEQPAGFLGLAFSADGRTVYASGGNEDLVYVYGWDGSRATLRDSLPLQPPHAERAHVPGEPAHARGRGSRSESGFLPASRSRAMADVSTSRRTWPIPSPCWISRLGKSSSDCRPGAIRTASRWGRRGPSTSRRGAAARWRSSARRRTASWRRKSRSSSGAIPRRCCSIAYGSRLFVASASTDRIAVVDTRRGRL